MLLGELLGLPLGGTAPTKLEIMTEPRDGGEVLKEADAAAAPRGSKETKAMNSGIDENFIHTDSIRRCDQRTRRAK